MLITFTMRTQLSPTEAARRITSMEDHRVPFTRIENDDGETVATTRLGPLTVIDRMTIDPLQVSGNNVRGRITKTGPILGGTLEFAAAAVEQGTVVGWRQDLTFLPCRHLDPILGLVMRLGYGIGFRALLRGSRRS